ncbi:methylated-DNA--[protein]-cysteine S-methyltransferase [Granulosicoccaceae sp. 1_MG-2023]|nr:methylated-DNA--[protein]-cysteine S-methyltransferase [Granulosicoccaceae sp. 1_MG-2023]
MNDYQRIAQAIEFIRAKGCAQPSLEEVAAAVHLSPWHLQRVFSRWAGVSPKRFLQALTVQQAKTRLRSGRSALLSVSHELGLSGAASLHDHFVTLEAVTPEQYRKHGEGLQIQTGIHDTPFGEILIAQTERGICHLSFIDGQDDPLEALRAEWPRAGLVRAQEQTAALAAQLCEPQDKHRGQPLSLWVRGTNFQLSVWRALLALKPGQLTCYGELARSLGRDGAARAVGSAVGANPVALIIPCHRVIRADGGLGGYRWGETRKSALLACETVRAGLL